MFHPYLRLIHAFTLTALAIISPQISLRAGEPAPLIPLAQFFGSPELAQVTLSPDGNFVAYVAPYKHRQNLFVKQIGSAAGIRLTSSADRDLGGYFWVGDHRLAYAIDEGGKENWRIFAVDSDGKDLQALTPAIGVQARLVAKLPGDDDHLLITLNSRDPRIADLYKIDVRTGASVLIFKNDQHFIRYVTDNAGIVRLAIATDGINFALYHRPNDESSFQRILTIDFRASVAPLFFTADNRYFYALSNRGRDKAAVMLMSPTDGAELDLVYQHPDYDAGGLLRDDTDSHVVGAYYLGEKPEKVFFDERARNRHWEMAAKFPGLVADFVSADRAGDRFIVKAWSDRDPGTFYTYDDKTKTLEKIGQVAPWIDPEKLARMEPVSYRSRDGLTIHGYLTKPLATAAPGPALIVVHGGPWARTQWRIDPETQFFANRGYTVLEVNYRGSLGYGRAFFEAGFKQWGKAMQDDLTDGVRWLIDQKIADPKRIGIYGISYGGYATLMGLAFTPELYRCGIDDSGVTDVVAWLSALPPQAQAVRAMIFTMVGDPQTDRASLNAISPISHVAQIKAPLLVAQGGNDPRVKITDVEKMVAALKAHGVEVDYLARANEGHSFKLVENRREFYRRAERFLAHNLGGREEIQP